MGTSYNPKIVTDGLVLNLDAGNRKSYPGAGTTWTDLTKNRYVANFIGSPAYSGSNGGLINFPGNATSSLTINGGMPIGASYTFECWIRPTLVAGVRRTIFRALNFGLYFSIEANTNNFILIIVGGGTAFLSTASGTVITNKWTHAVVNRDASNNHGIYINGFLSNSVNSSNYPGVDSTTIGLDRLDRSYDFQGDMSVIRNYNRTLTATEILQNYNATKGRFGL